MTLYINSQQNSKPQTSTNELESSVDTGPILLQLFQEPPGGSLGCGRNLKLWMFMHVLDPDPKIHETSSNIQVRNQRHPCQTSSGYEIQWHRDIHPASIDICISFTLGVSISNPHIGEASFHRPKPFCFGTVLGRLPRSIRPSLGLRQQTQGILRTTGCQGGVVCHDRCLYPLLMKTTPPRYEFWFVPSLFVATM